MRRRPIDPGELLMVGIPGPTLDGATRRRLADLGVRAVILFKRNVRSPAQLRRLCAALHRFRPGMLIGIDHEGGRVNRLPPPFTAFPPAAALARRGSLRLAFAAGEAMGRELAAVGVDLDFAPVLDVLTHRRNRVIGDRAFGTDPALVARLGLALAGGLRAAGVIPCGKHFPGHGATAGDSHFVLPRVRRTRAQLARAELVPFRAAVAARLPCLMTAHALYPALDPAHPASLSRRIVGDLLRRRLRFRGAVVSDDLQMGALSNRLTPGEAAVRALEAGSDLLLVCNSLDAAAAARAGLLEALATGRLPPARLREARGRIERLRRLRPRRRPALPRRWPEHAALARSIAGD